MQQTTSMNAADYGDTTLRHKSANKSELAG